MESRPATHRARAMRTRMLVAALIATAIACCAEGCGTTAGQGGAQGTTVASSPQIASSPGFRRPTQRRRPPEPAKSTTPPAATRPAFGQPTKSSGCHVRGQLPDRACTPGSVFARASASQICTPGYASSVRSVPESVKQQVYAGYGIASHISGSYEVDHLVSLELGGDNSVANLWPEVSPGFHEKDAIENELHADVCAGRVTLRAAQRQIARDWRHTAAGQPRTTSRPRRAAPSAPSSSGTQGSTPSGFCTTHTCIPSFDSGHGTIVQCADGEWSHSGGLPGVCSHHGGAR